ncbi:hypothetical protein AKJ43_01030 [candidate division MSBL1 archaeon SCGC-AAA261D19]|uniref:ATP-sulfurylase PUA-like domain-containing protein n=1 Tax=candidate division MSBL1 archaeon SCGC-AAA261D19 TaxID=1698273 RepID=A0A133V874_9EURY|nr:hypothetical protein AKJ43_01030 [candidate division MSBL1 archaeon SCGC-AAA261D19]
MGKRGPALKTSSGKRIAVLHLEEIFKYNKDEFVSKVFKTTDSEHPGVAWIYNLGEILLAGKVNLLYRPKRILFGSICNK